MTQVYHAKSFCSAGNYHAALETYKETHRKFPEDIECEKSYISTQQNSTFIRTKRLKKKNQLCVDQGLTFLVRLTNDMGLEEVQEYANKLKKAEKMREAREQVCLCPSGLIRFTPCYILFFFLY